MFWLSTFINSAHWNKWHTLGLCADASTLIFSLDFDKQHAKSHQEMRCRNAPSLHTRVELRQDIEPHNTAEAFEAESRKVSVAKFHQQQRPTTLTCLNRLPFMIVIAGWLGWQLAPAVAYGSHILRELIRCFVTFTLRFSIHINLPPIPFFWGLLSSGAP